MYTSVLNSTIDVNKVLPVQISILRHEWYQRFEDQWKNAFHYFTSKQFQLHARGNTYVFIWDRVQPTVRKQIEQRVDYILETTRKRWSVVNSKVDLFEVMRKDLQNRIKVIAQFESLSAQNFSEHTEIEWLRDDLGFSFNKVWVTEDDASVRHSHIDQHQMQLSLDQVFPNGCAFPGDPSASIQETLNCRCHLRYIRI